MGWHLTYHHKPADYLRYWQSKYADGNGAYNVLKIKRTCYGTRAWVLYELIATKEKFIVLYLFRKGEGGGWWYKDLDETMHPYFYDCPLSLIKEAGPTNNKSANEWRDGVKNYHQSRKAKHETNVSQGSPNTIGPESVHPNSIG